VAVVDEEINKGYGDLPRGPGRWTPPYRRSAAGASGAGPHAAATASRDARRKSSSSTPSPCGTKCPPRPGFHARSAAQASSACFMGRPNEP